MHIKNLERIVAVLREIDAVQEELTQRSDLRPMIKDYLIGSMVQLRTEVLARVEQEEGIKIEV